MALQVAPDKWVHDAHSTTAPASPLTSGGQFTRRANAASGAVIVKAGHPGTVVVLKFLNERKRLIETSKE
jgi:hypothetical protein